MSLPKKPLSPRQSSTDIIEDPNQIWNDNELKSLRDWIYGICLVDFDLSEGQITKFCYPFDILSNKEKTNIANLGFPDTHSSDTDMIETQFCFRFRSKADPKDTFVDEPKLKYLSYILRLKKNIPYLFGYVHFRQRKDSNIERGYFQKSIVIITDLPYHNVFIECVKIIGNLYFDHGHKILQSACKNIATWQSPLKYGNVNLPILGNVIRAVLTSHHYHLPHVTPSQTPTPTHSNSVSPPNKKIKKPNSSVTTDNGNGNDNQKSKPNILEMNGAEMILNSTIYPKDKQYQGGIFKEINIYECFKKVLGNLWYLWELSLSGAPVLIICNTAKECSESVLGYMSLISPITYYGDYRPYFTIYDDDFRYFCELHDRNLLNTKTLVIGCTNPFVIKSLTNFPHILTLYDPKDNNNDDNDDDNDDDNVDDQVNSETKEADVDDVDQVVKIHASTANNHTGKRIKSGGKAFLSHSRKNINLNKIKNTIISTDSPCLHRDKQVLSKILKINSIKTTKGAVIKKHEHELKQIGIINNATLRKYFQDMTVHFLKPFYKYFTFNKPKGLWNPYLKPPKLKEWNKEMFLKELLMNDDDDDVNNNNNNVNNKKTDDDWDLPYRVKALSEPITSLTGSLTYKQKLYKKFIESPHFHYWFGPRRRKAQRQRLKLIHKMIIRVKFVKLVEGRPVPEGIAMYRIIHQIMLTNNSNDKPNAQLNNALLKHRHILRKALGDQHIDILDKQINEKKKLALLKSKTITPNNNNSKNNNNNNTSIKAKKTQDIL